MTENSPLDSPEFAEIVNRLTNDIFDGCDPVEPLEKTIGEDDDYYAYADSGSIYRAGEEDERDVVVVGSEVGGFTVGDVRRELSRIGVSSTGERQEVFPMLGLLKLSSVSDEDYDKAGVISPLGTDAAFIIHITHIQEDAFLSLPEDEFRFIMFIDSDRTDAETVAKRLDKS